MMFRVSVCVVVILQIGGVIALVWTNNSTDLVSCKHKDVKLRWEYEIEPGEYVKAKTWFTGMNTAAKRIAYWKDTDGVTVEPAYANRIEMLGNDGFVLRDVKAEDEGLYGMIASMPLSSERDPRQTLNLTIYISPLKEEGCCKPEIDVRGDTLVAFLSSYQGCGKPSPGLTWVEHRDKTVKNSTLYLGKTDREGRYNVCVTGPAIDECFPGDKKTLCRTHDVIHNATAHYTWQEETAVSQSTVAVIVSTCVVFLLIVILVMIVYIRRKQKGDLMTAKRKTGRKSKELAFLLYEIAGDKEVGFVEKVIHTRQTTDYAQHGGERNGSNSYNMKHVLEARKERKKALDSTYLTTQLINFYETKLPTSNGDSDIQYDMQIYEQEYLQSEKYDTSLYEDILCKNTNTLNRILLQGDAGCGKKTWCYSFIRTWCQAQVLSGDKEKSENKNINFMSTFKLLFSVSLRDVTVEKDINELLKRQHIPNFYSLQGDIYTHLRTHSNVIFLVQGLDEYTGNADVVKELLTDKRLEKALIIFISRPMTQNSFMNKFGTNWPFSRTVTIKGLDKKHLLKRAEEILKEDGHPTKSLHKFSLLVEKQKLSNLMQEPIFFPFLIGIWQNSNTLPSCKAEFMLNVLENQIKKKRNSFLRQYRDKTDYQYDFNENFMLINKVFICHYGLILRSLGKIALDLQRDKTNIFGSGKFEEERFCNFCANVDLICRSQVSPSDSHEETFSFQHRTMQLFLAALYIISRSISERRKEISAMWSGADGENLVDTRNPENMDNSIDSSDSEENREYCEFLEYVTYLSFIA